MEMKKPGLPGFFVFVFRHPADYLLYAASFQL
jgi:hypothetical protein